MALHMALLVALSCGHSPSALAQACPLDDGNVLLAVEGLILTRNAFSIIGAPPVASTGINAVDTPTVEAAINCPNCGINITGNPTMTVADATIISRKIAGFTGSALTDNLALGGGTITTNGLIAADTAFLQRRTAAPCALGSFITGIAADGTPNCATPPSGAGGTVTNAATGNGLTGGPITATGTIALANTQKLPSVPCATHQIAKWRGTAWACTASQPAFPATCLDGRLLKLEAGAIVWSAAPQTFVNADGIAGRQVGRHPSVAIPEGGDGQPVISYFDATNSGFKVAKRGNAACSAGNTVCTMDGPSLGQGTAIAVPADGVLFVAYYDVANTHLKTIKGSNAGCANP